MTRQAQSNLKEILPLVMDIAKMAGDAILDVRNRTALDINYKSDRSPVTAADMAAHNVITNALNKISDLPILSEESAHIPYETRKTWSEYWLIDPLDGTREFIESRDDFTVNIGLILRNDPVLGVIHLPVTKDSYHAYRGGGAYKTSGDGSTRQIRARTQLAGKPVIAVSLSHANKQTEDFIKRLGDCTLVRRGSIIKSCMVAEGIADLYTRFGNTSEWDTAAGQCILEEANGYLTDMDNVPLRYNMKDSLLNPPFVSSAPSSTNWQSIVNEMKMEK